MNNNNSIQPNLFEATKPDIEIEKVLLFAFGEFQSRKKMLADRELPLDRLLGAFKRASEKFGVEELSDERLAESLRKIGVKVVQVPTFVAKHPFRITVGKELAEKADEFYKSFLEND